MRPKIGVLPLYDSERDRLWIVPKYMKAIEQAGGAPLLLPMTGDRELLEELLEELDGFLFTGGQDVNPALYGEPVLPGCAEICESRDMQEHYMMKRLVELDKPFFCICRGFQLMNAVLGGTLYQDLPTYMLPAPGAEALHHYQEPPYYETAHSVAIVTGTRLHACLGVDQLAVNSIHHQGIKQLAPGAVAGAYASDGLIEGIELPHARLAMAVQWHPEYLFEADSVSRRLFSLLVETSRG